MFNAICNFCAAGINIDGIDQGTYVCVDCDEILSSTSSCSKKRGETYSWGLERSGSCLAQLVLRLC